MSTTLPVSYSHNPSRPRGGKRRTARPPLSDALRYNRVRVGPTDGHRPGQADRAVAAVPDLTGAPSGPARWRGRRVMADFDPDIVRDSLTRLRSKMVALSGRIMDIK